MQYTVNVRGDPASLIGLHTTQSHLNNYLNCHWKYCSLLYFLVCPHAGALLNMSPALPSFYMTMIIVLFYIVYIVSKLSSDTGIITQSHGQGSVKLVITGKKPKIYVFSVSRQMSIASDDLMAVFVSVS